MSLMTQLNLVIDAATRPTPDPEQIAHEPSRLAYDVHRRARRVHDRHRHLFDLQALGLGDEEDLDVEGEPVDLRPLEDEPAGAGAEGLQAALCVAIVAEQHRTGEPVDDAPAHLPQAPRSYQRARALVLPATDHDV